MIRSFRHKGLQQFSETGSKSGIRPNHAKKLELQLAVLDSAQSLSDLPAAWKPHRLTGTNPAGKSVAGHFGMWVDAIWRLTFEFDGFDVHLLDYLDYH